MKIKNSRLELNRLEDLSKYRELEKRTDLRYKILFAINPTSEATVDYPCVSCSFRQLSISAAYSVIKKYQDYYYITVTKSKAPSDIEYSLEEKKILISIFSGLADIHNLDSAELFCHAIGNSELLDMFYSDYGRMDRTRALCMDLCEATSIPEIKNTSDVYPHQYQRSRYSIYELADDLINSKAYICTDPDLTGKYEKISRNTKTGATMIGGTWCPIIGKSLNKTRANLNLIYLATVEIIVPENTHNVTPGPRTLKTLKAVCLVKDGKVCNDIFGVRIKDKRVEKKIKSAGIVKSGLVYSEDYAVRLSSLPVISKSKISGIRSFDLGTAEVWYRLSDIAIEYIQRKEYKEKMKLHKLPEKINKDSSKSEEELYLNSLGIYGDYYYPKREVGEVIKTYKTEELISKLGLIPTKDTYVRNITRLLNGNSVNNHFTKDFITTYVQPDLDRGMSYSDLLEIWERRKNKYRDQIRDLKFRLILGKSLKVCCHSKGRRSILKTSQEIRIGNYKTNVSWGLKDTYILV